MPCIDVRPRCRQHPDIMEMEGNFAQWACDPKRTLEERFGAQLLIETTDGPWKKKHGVENPVDYQVEQLRKKERSGWISD